MEQGNRENREGTGRKRGWRRVRFGFGHNQYENEMESREQRR